MASDSKKTNGKPKPKSKPKKSTVIVDMRRPRKPQAILDLLTSGGDPNRGRLSPQEYLKAHKEFGDGNGPGQVLYQPGLVQFAAVQGSGQVAVCGRGKVRPDSWNDGQLGKWGCVTDEDCKIKSGDVVHKVRLHHSRDLTKRVAPDCLINVDGVGQVVLGHEGINGQTTGCYSFIVEALKAFAFEGNTQTNKIVGLINADPCIETLEHGGKIVWPALTAVDWGYLVKGGNRLSHDQVAKTDGKGVTFEVLDEPIIGTPITVSKLVTAVKSAMSKAGTKREGDDRTAWERFGYETDEAARDAVETNITTLTRFNPRTMGCFGLRSVQCGMPVFFCFSEDGKTQMVNMTIGMRLPLALVENQWDARARTAPEKPAPKAKTPKSDAKPKTKRKAKVKVTDPTNGDAAPPVVDTTETTETVEPVAEPVLTAQDVDNEVFVLP